jgi:hypothetical protein
MRSLAALVLLMVFASEHAAASELTPFVKDQRLGVVIRTLELPATFPKDLMSGLTNRLLIRVALVSQSQQVVQKTAEVAMKYDLWDEDFAVTLTVSGAVITTQTYSSVMEVRTFLADIRLPGLFARSEVPGASGVILRAEVLLNPIERERMAAIRRWVAQNSTYTPSDTDGFGSERGVGISHSNTIFNRIFEQYSQGMDLVAAWKETVSSKPFNIEEVGSE